MNFVVAHAIFSLVISGVFFLGITIWLIYDNKAHPKRWRMPLRSLFTGPARMMLVWIWVGAILYAFSAVVAVDAVEVIETR